MMATITFVLSDSRTKRPLAFVPVILDGVTNATDQSGRATFDGVVDGSHKVNIRTQMYRPFTADIETQGDAAFEIALDPATV